MKKIILFMIALFSVQLASAQMFFTKEGHVSFFSSTPMENIEANNYKSTSIINSANGQMEFAVLMKAFEFQKALMQEHFNEEYMETDKYPQAVFKGQIENMSDLNLKKDGIYNVKTKGTMDIHGVTKEIEVPGTITVKGGKIVAGYATFTITPEDYNVQIPSLVREKIAKEIKVTVDMAYQEFQR